jgi:hypothetical protein
MLSKKVLHISLGVVIGFFGFLLFDSVKESFDKPQINNKEVTLAVKDLKEEYMNDDEPLSENKFIGDEAVRNELAERLLAYQDIRNYKAYDYSNAHTKLDIIPDYKKFLSFDFSTASGGLSGDSEVFYSINNKIIEKSYSSAETQKLYLDARFLNSFLKPENKKLFEKSLKANGMDLDSFVEVGIEHGKYAFDNMDPNLFSSSTYANKMRRELDSLNYSEIKKLDSNTYELINSHQADLPLMVGFKVIRFRSILTFDSADSFTLERSANKQMYFKIEFHHRATFIPLKGITKPLEELDYRDEFISPDISF